LITTRFIEAANIIFMNRFGNISEGSSASFNLEIMQSMTGFLYSKPISLCRNYIFNHIYDLNRLVLANRTGPVGFKLR
jgi:hypothetical protein